MNSLNFLSPRCGQLSLVPGVQTAHDAAIGTLTSAGLVASTPIVGVLYVHAGDVANRLDVSLSGGIVRWTRASSEPWTACRAGALTDPQAFVGLCRWILKDEIDGLPTELEVNGRYLELLGASVIWLSEDEVLAVQRPDRPERWLFAHPDGTVRFQDDPSGVVLTMDVDLRDLAQMAEYYQQLDQIFEELCEPVAIEGPE